MDISKTSSLIRMKHGMLGYRLLFLARSWEAGSQMAKISIENFTAGNVAAFYRIFLYYMYGTHGCLVNPHDTTKFGIVILRHSRHSCKFYVTAFVFFGVLFLFVVVIALLGKGRFWQLFFYFAEINLQLNSFCRVMLYIACFCCRKMSLSLCPSVRHDPVLH